MKRSVSLKETDDCWFLELRLATYKFVTCLEEPIVLIFNRLKLDKLTKMCYPIAIMKRFFVILALVLLSVLLGTTFQLNVKASEKNPVDTVVPNGYIVVLKDSVSNPAD